VRKLENKAIRTMIDTMLSSGAETTPSVSSAGMAAVNSIGSTNSTKSSVRAGEAATTDFKVRVDKS